jgi:putative transposase
MNNTLQVGKTRWTHYQIAYHFVWIPKYRRRILMGDVQKVTKESIETCCLTHGFSLLALETDEEHVHCFVSAPPKDSPAKIVGLLKGYSSRMVRQKFPSLAKRTGKEQLWTSAYFVGTAGAVSSEVIRRYIMECQGK